MQLIRISVFLSMAALALGFAGVSAAAPTTYFHASDGTCGGNSPCYNAFTQALQNVDDGGTVILLSDVDGSITATEGKQNITIRGVPSTVEFSSQVLLEEVVTGWILEDFEVAYSFVIHDVASSLRVDNVTAGVIKVGDTTRNMDADISITNSTVRGTGSISVIGGQGYSIGGTISIRNNEAGAINIKVSVSPGGATNLDADIVITNNLTINSGGITVLGVDAAGEGNVTGSVLYANNTGTAADAKFGVSLFGDVTGDITGPVTFHRNDLSWLAVITMGATAGGIGRLTMTENRVEAFEFNTIGGPISGPVVIRDNEVLDLGGATGLNNPLLLVDGATGVGDVTVENNTAPDADVVVRTSGGTFSGTAVIRDNRAGLLTLDSQASDFVQPFEVSGNFLPPTIDPRLGKITIRTLSNGAAAGGTVVGNTSDELIVNFDGALAGDLTTTGNIVREEAKFYADGATAGSDHDLVGNDFQGTLFINGLDSLVRFNRLAGNVTVIQGTTVDASLNWWGCNDGPGTPDCSAPLTAGFTTDPWLTFSGRNSCDDLLAQADFDLLTASDSSTTAGNVTPASVIVTTQYGTVLVSPVELAMGSGCSLVRIDGGASMPSVTMELDNESITAAADCSLGILESPCNRIFTGGFETSNTVRWSDTFQ